MKKLLISILGIFFGLISFSSASSFDFNYIRDVYFLGDVNFYEQYGDSYSGYTLNLVCPDSSFSIYDSSNNFLGHGNSFVFYLDNQTFTLSCDDPDNGCYTFIFGTGSNVLGGGSSTSSDITVYYNNGQTTSIACNGDNIITIDGLSAMSSISTFTPYFNINYTDQNNQVLTDSYSNSILYLSGGQYLKTYTGGSNNDWILNLISSEDTVFTGYLPIFDVTGNITEIDTGNVFNNFAENSLTVLLSNIPNYIQYVIMFALLLFFLGIFRRLRK